MTLQTELYIPFAEQLATIAGEIVRQHYGKPIKYDIKADSSPVTIVDREIERNLRATIHNTYPEHGIIGEEYEPVNENADIKWIIDPIDGTKSFMIGRPIFGTMISLLHHNTPVLGIIDQPILGERWTGVKGFATNFNYDPTRSRMCPDIKHAVFCTTSPNLFNDGDREKFEQIRKSTQYVVYGGDCYSYGLIARGTVDIVVETQLKPYDFCALRPIIEGSGGIITDWQGNSLTLESDGKVLACGDRRVHSQALEILNT